MTTRQCWLFGSTLSSSFSPARKFLCVSKIVFSSHRKIFQSYCPLCHNTLFALFMPRLKPQTFARRYKQEVGPKTPIKVSPSTTRPHSSDELFVKLNINCRDSTMETRKLRSLAHRIDWVKLYRESNFRCLRICDKSDENIKWIKCLPNELLFQWNWIHFLAEIRLRYLL